MRPPPIRQQEKDGGLPRGKLHDGCTPPKMKAKGRTHSLQKTTPNIKNATLSISAGEPTKSGEQDLSLKGEEDVALSIVGYEERKGTFKAGAETNQRRPR